MGPIQLWQKRPVQLYYDDTLLKEEKKWKKNKSLKLHFQKDNTPYLKFSSIWKVEQSLWTPMA